MSETVKILMPASQQEGTESVIANWFKKVGDAVQKNEPLLEISTDKVVVEIPAPASGILREIIKSEGAEVEVGAQLGIIEVGIANKTNSNSSTDVALTKPTVSSKPAIQNEQRLSPAVRKLIELHKLDVSTIRGTGAGGRITTKDVEALVGQATDINDKVKSDTTFIKHSPMRKSIAAHMVNSLLKTAPHVTALFEADMSAVIAHRERHKADYLNQGTKLTFTSYFIRAAVHALKAVPEINSRWHDDGLEIFSDCNIGVATAISEGLIVPVLKSAEQLDLITTATQLEKLVERARLGKISQAELESGTFTITNHGVSGSLLATPIIHQPQSAILGIGKLEQRVTALDGQILIRPKLYITLTIDHRALDGFKANAFLSAYTEFLEHIDNYL